MNYHYNINPNYEFLNYIGNENITHSSLILLGYKKHICGYYCPPVPVDCGVYRLERESIDDTGSKYRAYITNADHSTVRIMKTLSELRDFHKGMGGDYLF